MRCGRKFAILQRLGIFKCMVFRDVENFMDMSDSVSDYKNYNLNNKIYRRIKVIRHVFGFGIEFLENKGIDIFRYFIAIDFIKRYSYHTYSSPISTS